MAFVLVLCWCVLITSLPAWGGEKEDFARRIQAFYEGTDNFQAEFEQEVYWRRGQKVRLSRGRVWFKKPGLMRWEYTWPDPLLVVCDGKEVYVYSTQDKQVMVFPGSKALSPKVTLGFMSGKGNLLRDFYLEKLEKLPGGKIALLVRPRTSNPQIERLRLLAEASSGRIQEIWFWDYLGNLTKIRFLKVKVNQKMAEELFRFRPPKGVDIIKER